MDQDKFNMSMRKFLKKVGVTSQREIEQAVQDALDSGALHGDETLSVRMTLTIDKLGKTHEVKDEIALE